MKRTELVVNSESPLGAARGATLAFAEIEKGHLEGKAALPKHGITVQWRVVDVVQATDVSKGSILTPSAPPVAPNLPDISGMDIEEAKGIVGTASLEELEILEMVERSSARVPGGRKGVLVFIERRKTELMKATAKKATEAVLATAGKVKKSDSVLVMGGAVVEGDKTT